MANWYVSSVKYAAIAQWAATTAYTVGQLVRQLAAPTAANARVFKCTTAGTSGGTEPTWNLGDGATTVSGTATFTQVAGREAEQATGNWAAPFANLLAANAIVTSLDDVVFVADDHSETYAAATSFAGAGAARICVVAGSTVPPVEADLSRGAQVETTGNNTLTLTNSCLFKGFDFRGGQGGTNTLAIISIDSNGKFDDCRFKIGSTSGTAFFTLGPTSLSRGTVEFYNDCRFEFGNVAQSFQAGFSEILFENCPNMFIGSFVPTGDVFEASAANGNRPFYTVRHCNLSNLTGVLIPGGAFGWVSLENCLLNAAATYGSGGSAPGLRNNIRVHNCVVSGGVNYAFMERGTYSDVEISTGLYRTNGASDGVTPVSWRVTAKTGLSRYGFKATPPKINKRVNDTGSSKTFTVHGLILTDNIMTLTRAGAWGEFHIMTDVNSPVGTLVSTQSSLLTTTALQASTDAWDAGLPARTNNAARTAGYLQKVASNPGRVFRVTASGTTAASEPAAYATAVDGDTFADGTATIRCCRRVKFEVTATPARKGNVTFTFQMSATANGVFHLDPKIVVT